MSAGNRIQYIPGHSVDKEKWDRCISQSANGLIYGNRIYLDVMADHWNAVIIDDYSAVMPLPWRKKLFFSYYYHVPFIPQTGVFGKLDPALFKELSKVMFGPIRLGDILLNYGNAALGKFFSAKPLVNMVLDLSPSYEVLAGKYHKVLVKNLKSAAKYQHVYSVETHLKLAVALFKKYYGSRIASVGDADYERFTSLCLHLHQSNKAFARKVTDHKGKVLAIALLLKDDRRIYNMMNAVLPEGRKKSANHFLYDNIIREFAGSDLVLDMEGSDIPGIRKFYVNFGTVNEPYYFYSKLPVVVQMLKGRI